MWENKFFNDLSIYFPWVWKAGGTTSRLTWADLKSDRAYDYPSSNLILSWPWKYFQHTVSFEFVGKLHQIKKKKNFSHYDMTTLQSIFWYLTLLQWENNLALILNFTKYFT